jgi:hypothetical protein
MYPLFPIMFLFWLPMWSFEALLTPPCASSEVTDRTLGPSP